MPELPITRIVLYKHGVGYFEREGTVEGDRTLSLTFKQAEVSDVLKSLIVLDLDGGHVSSVSYDSTKPLQQLLAEVALEIPDENALHGLLPQLKGARVRLSQTAAEAVEGVILGLDTTKTRSADGVVDSVSLSLLNDVGEVRSFDLRELAALQILDEAMRRDLDFYLRTELSGKRKDSRTFAIFAKGEGTRRLRMAYTVEAPVWKATYRLILGEEANPPMIQGWAVVDNTQDEDWENITLSLVSGLPVSFVHDLYTPRYIQRPVVAVQETTGVLPPEVVDSFLMEAPEADERVALMSMAAAPPALSGKMRAPAGAAFRRSAVSSAPAQVRERKLGDLFQYEIEHAVTIKRNQAALVPIVLRPFKGRSVLLYNKANRAENPMRCVEFENTTGLTLEGGPVTVLEGGDYVGEAMLDTLKPDEMRLVPFAVELSVSVLDNVNSRDDRVSKVVIRDGQLKAQYGQLRKTTYTFNNKADEPYVMYLEHPRTGPDWELLEPESPFAVTETHWRLRFDLPAKKITAFVVRDRRLQWRVHALSDLDPKQLGYWINQRYLDEPTEAVLRELSILQRQSAEADAQIQRLNTERGSIHTEQQRIRDNLKSLGDRASEKELRERFVRTLNTQENRLEAIDAQIADLTTKRDRLRVQSAEMLGKLELDLDVPAESRKGKKGD